MILKKSETVGNSIIRAEDIPDLTATFTREYAFNVTVSPKYDWVRFRVLVGSTLPFGKLFKQREMGIFQQFQEHGWWANKIAIAHQGTHFHIGFVKYVHPVFSNHDNVLEDYKEIFGDITVDIDIQSKYETKNFYSKEEGNEVETKERLRVRVLALSTPSDIASRTTEALLQEWDKRLKSKEHRYNRLQDSLFIPYTKRMLPEEDQITHLLEQGEWLGRHKDAIFLLKCENMNQTFECTEEIAEVIKTEKAEQETSLRKILLDWRRDLDGDFSRENLMIQSVEQVDSQKT